jgi:hypothetical protein
MGIKFHCPNGHKLNVKAFLAGKKGVCPKCGTKFRIPTASEPGMGDSDLEDSEASAAVAKPGNGKPALAASVGGGGAPAPGTSVASVAVQPAKSKSASHEPRAGMAAAVAETAAANDPIAQNPAAIWYVRPPTGGQYGPARGEIMRKWLSEGRVSSDSLVWREGWPEWQTAGKLFPHLQAAGAGAMGASVGPTSSVDVAPRASSKTTTHAPSSKRATMTRAIIIIASLAAIVVILGGVLVYKFVTLQ